MSEICEKLSMLSCSLPHQNTFAWDHIAMNLNVENYVCVVFCHWHALACILHTFFFLSSFYFVQSLSIYRSIYILGHDECTFVFFLATTFGALPYWNRCRCVFISFPYIFSNKILFFFLLISFVHSHAIKYRYVIWAMNREYECVSWTRAPSSFTKCIRINDFYEFFMSRTESCERTNVYMCVCFAWANDWRRLHMEIENSI